MGWEKDRRDETMGFVVHLISPRFRIVTILIQELLQRRNVVGARKKNTSSNDSLWSKRPQTAKLGTREQKAPVGLALPWLEVFPLLT